jgi:hypothetical protein
MNLAFTFMPIKGGLAHSALSEELIQMGNVYAIDEETGYLDPDSPHLAQDNPLDPAFVTARRTNGGAWQPVVSDYSAYTDPVFDGTCDHLDIPWVSFAAVGTLDYRFDVLSDKGAVGGSAHLIAQCDSNLLCTFEPSIIP